MIDQEKTEVGAVFYVRSLSRTVDFYSKVLGLRIDRREAGTESYGEGRIGATWFIFFEGSTQAVGRSPVLVLSVHDSIHATVEELIRQDVEVITPVSEAPGGLSADFLDPDGHVLSLYQAVESK